MNLNLTLWFTSHCRSLLKKLAVLTMLALLFPLFSIAQVVYTFTNAGATGRTGPTQAQVNTAYTATTLAGKVTINTQGIQEWTVPYTGSYTIETWGAGSTDINTYGAKYKGTFSLTSGQKLYIAVGQQAPSFGGGNGGAFVATGTSLAASTPLIVSGGGGGLNNVGYSSTYGLAIFTNSAQSGDVGYGGTAGNGGQTNTNNTSYGGGGGGGFYSNGVNTSSYGYVGQAFVFGANGGNKTLCTNGNIDGGFGGGGAGYSGDEPAGGGGYSGGGGGGYNGSSSTGLGTNRFGGGGGSYNSGTSQVQIGVTNSGNGKVVITNLFSASITQTANIECNGASTGALSVTVAGSTGPYTYAWSPNVSTSSTVSGLPAGTYNVTVTSASSATTTASFTITQPTALAATTSQTNVSCNGGSNGTATVVVSGGTAAYTYSWSPSGGTGATATGRSAGTYICIITDANGCTLSKSITITQPTALAATTSQTNVSCNGGSNGSAGVVVSGGTGAYSYAWSPSGGTAASANGLTAGTYTCTITDANSCTLTKSFSITQPTALAATTSQVNVSCNGGSNGSAGVVVTGGTAAYSYAWSPSGGTAATASGLTTGTYTCVITDANACTLTKSFSITQPTALAATTSQTNVSCNGGSNGTASVVASGGAGGYTYAWSPSGGTAATASGRSAGTYTCTITDANGCTLTKSFTITQPAALAATTSKVDVSCNGGSNGSAGVVVTGGTGAYTYNWTPSGGTAATAMGRSAGTYTCTITDENGCTLTKSFTITQPTALAATTSQVNVSCNGGSNGSASVVVSGGTTAYSYAWLPSGGTAATASGLNAGTYTCTITDANACTLTKSFTITQPTALAATTSQVNVSCNGGSNGSASVAVSGGTTAYSYAWSPSGGTAATASGLIAGTYTCIITDANGCTLSKSFTITQPAALAATTSQVNVSCNGGSNGSAGVVVTGGTGAYTYNWTPSGGIAATTTGRSAGTYICTITDANACTLTKSFTITQPAALAATTTQTNVSCNGGSNGSAGVVVSGGTGAYSYSWSPSGGTAANTTGRSAGTYICTITDANGCTLTKSFSITQPTALAATTSQVNVSCNAGSNGSAGVVVTGGTAAYSYAWSPSGGTAATASGLIAGTYTCTITDANSCTLTKSFTITQPTALAATTSQVNVSCNGGSNGSAKVVVNGGTTAYSYAWLPTGGTADFAISLNAATYTCTITDANGCTLSKPISITQPTAMAATISQVNVSCNGGSNGSAGVVVTGGTGAYSYSWSPSGGSAATTTGRSAGTYTCTITDANGCVLTKSLIITQPTALIATTSQVNVICIGGNNGSASVVVAGGTPTYTYSWLPSGGSAATASGLIAAVYTCTISDANGCTLTKSFTIIQSDIVNPVAVAKDVTIFLSNSGNASITASDINNGSTDNCSIASLSASKTNFTCADLGANNVTLTVTDASGNTSTAIAVVTVSDNLSPVADVSILPDVKVECSANVTPPTATDNCAGVVTATTSDPMTYSVQGSYIIHWTYSDGNGNSSYQNQNVIVADVTVPVADIAMLPDVSGECSASVVAPIATDNCAGVVTATTPDPLTYSVQGSFIIHWTYNDGNGNSSTQDQNVIVADVTAPVADIAMLPDVNGECSVSALAPTATDNCAGVVTATTSDPLSYDAQGSYIIHWTYSDGNGNSSTQNQNVMVADVTAPVADIAMLPDVTGECSASVVAPTATDNCTGVVTATTVDPVSYDTQGSYIIHWTYTDGNGNSSTQDQNVIVADVTAPSFICSNDTSVISQGTAGQYTVTGSTFDPKSVTDNCSTATLVNNVTNSNTLDGAILSEGENAITWTATDESGNTYSCTTTFTVEFNVGIHEIDYRNVSVYPNPSKGIFNLEIPASCDAVIYDVRGKVIQTEKLVNGLNSIDMSNKQQGVYLLKLIKNDKVVNVKLILE